MKFSKKFFIVLGLVAILASLFASTALAADTRMVRYANVNKIRVMDDQPATFRLLGNYTCDKVQFNTSVSGKVITIYAYDAKVRYTGHGCDTTKSFLREITVGPLVPGVYTILVNPNENGKGQKILKGFIAPMIPTPAAAPAQ
jgi:hypothetical protein